MNSEENLTPAVQQIVMTPDMLQNLLAGIQNMTQTQSQQSDNENNADGVNFSLVDFDEFKCSQCEKYLSVSPVYMYTDPIGKEKNICGRCKLPEDGPSLRNVSFEALAKYLKFPCSVSKNCKEKLTWGESEAHEKKCRYRQVDCIICLSSYSVTSVVNHFKQNHQKELFANKNLTFSEGDICNHTYPRTSLVVCPKIICLVHISVDTVFRVKIEPVFASTIPHAFTITFSTRNNVVSLKNKQIRSCEDSSLGWKEYQFDINCILDIFVSDSSEFKMELEIYEEEKHEHVAGQSTRKENPSSSSANHVIDEVSTTLNEISSALECPTCFDVMTSKIFVCRRGHSICEECKKLVPVCPSCKDNFIGTRNFSLEEIARKLLQSTPLSNIK